ncbi:MAG: thymidylate synthase [Candidatus Aenigmatarchaeota archaeon]
MIVMQQYLNALRFILEKGAIKHDRTDTGTKAVFGMQFRYDMEDGFPLVTTKKMPWKSVASELLWFIEGSNDERRLAELLHGTRDPEKQTIWTQNANASYWKPHAKFEGDLGRIYGVQWRHWNSNGKEIDQLARAIDLIKKDPTSRRIIVSAWHPGELDYEEQQPPVTALCPCHIFYQFFVASGKLSLQMYQRSCDMLLGVPFNIASYSLLLNMVAQVTGLKAGDFVHTLGDAHIYQNHFEQVKEQLSREPFPLPSLWLNPSIKSIDNFKMDDIRIDNYQSHPAIKAPMAV